MNKTGIASIVENDIINSGDFFNLINPENNLILADEVMLASIEGKILWVSENYEQNFGFEHGSIIGKSVYDLERDGVFKPSVTAEVIKKGEKVTRTQTINSDYANVMTTGLPLLDKSGAIKYVACFNTVSMEQINAINRKYQELQKSITAYEQELDWLRTRTTETDIVVRSASMRQIWSQLESIANTDANILLTGETGVGKSAIAKAIHSISNISDGPFIEVNCAALNDNLLEAELFGYERSVFAGTPAEIKIGKIELANHGTLFLDEIGGLSLKMQARLLQVIQEKTISRLSSNRKINVDFRLITSTNLNLAALVAGQQFRADLYYRINVVGIDIPPLKERTEDIVPLADFFLSDFSKKYKKSLTFSPRFLTYLESNEWPGNVRELENLIERLVITASGPIIDVTELPKYNKPHGLKSECSSLPDQIEALEKAIITESYKRLGSSVAVAKELGISQPTAARKIIKYVKSEK